MDDERLSSVDQFLRENGFSLSDSALAIASLSDDELLDDEDFLLSVPAPSGRSDSSSSRRSSSATDPPRFVLLEDESLLQERQNDERLSGDRTSERPEDAVGAGAGWPDREGQVEEGSLIDLSGLERSRLSLSSASMDLVDSRDQEQARGSRLPSSVVSSLSSQRNEDVAGAVDRVLDDELNNALGVPGAEVVTGAERLSLSSRRSREEDGGESAAVGGRDGSLEYSRMLERGRSLCTENGDDGGHAVKRSDVGGRMGGLASYSGDARSRYRRNWRSSGFGDVEEKSEIDEELNVRYRDAKSEECREHRDAVGTDEGAWNGLNDLLRKNGLPALRFRRAESEVVPEQGSLFSVIHDFGVQLARKNETIEDLLLSSQRNSRLRSRWERELQTMVKKNEVAQKALEKAQAEIQRLKTSQKKESESTELLSRKLKSSCLRLQQQLKVSEHRVKAKEVVVQKMQTKLQQQADRETLKKARDRHVFRDLQDRDPRRANPRDIQTLETIGVYEAQREQMQEEIDHLKLQVTALNSELRDKDNCIVRQSSAFLKRGEPAVWELGFDESCTGQLSGVTSRLQDLQHRSSSVASDDVMLEVLEAARCEQELAAAKLRRREAVMMKKVAMIERELVAARETISELKDEKANRVFESESRIRDNRTSQRRIDHLERQVVDDEVALDGASELDGLREDSGAKERTGHDRLNHRSQLNRLDKLSRETVVEVVKHVCRVLHLSDITLIVPSIEKLCNVVAAVPRMEKFIRDVCGFVLLHDETTGQYSATSELEQVLPTLHLWAEERQNLCALEKFKTSIMTELSRRITESGVRNDEKDSSRVEDAPNYPTILSRAVRAVSELVELEKGVIHHRDMYTLAAEEVERRPNDLVNPIVRHFAYLFQVRNIDGILPKMNETYLMVNEMKNFVHAIRGILRLKKDSSLVYCLDIIKELLQESVADAMRVRAEEPNDGNTEENHVFDGCSLNFVVEKCRSSARGGNSETNLAGVQEVREMSVLIRELRRELGATTMDDILPRTKCLMELLSLSIYNAGE
uniref:Centrosomal protein of 70 kDa n=1 Tax=Peronospora matthiolae TaxID=2874970 RepID=A0AAV1TRF6_9STRA